MFLWSTTGTNRLNVWCLGSSPCVTDEDSLKISLRLKDISIRNMKASVCSTCVSRCSTPDLLWCISHSLNVDSISKDEQIKLVINQANIAHTGISVMGPTTLQLVELKRSTTSNIRFLQVKLWSLIGRLQLELAVVLSDEAGISW
jgi:hypothetical protein